MQELYQKDWDYDIDSSDLVEKNMIVGYKLSGIDGYHSLKTERAEKIKKLIDQIQEATTLEF